MKTKINKSHGDELFIKTCVDILDSAQKSVYVIAGELGSFVFPELQMATYKASKRSGVKVQMYATEHASISYRNFAVACGYDLFVGKKGLTKHYLLVDDKNFVVSEDKIVGKQTIIGERCGWVHYNEKKNAMEIKKKFDMLVADKNTNHIQTIDKKAEPLYQFLYSE